MGFTEIVALLIKYGPEVVRAIMSLWKKQTPPTEAEWEAVFALCDKSYDQYIQEAASRVLTKK